MFVLQDATGIFISAATLSLSAKLKLEKNLNLVKNPGKSHGNITKAIFPGIRMNSSMGIPGGPVVKLLNRPGLR